MNEQMNGGRNGWIDLQTDGQMDDGWMDGQMKDGQIHRWKDR